MIWLRKYFLFINLFFISGFILSQELDTLELPFDEGIWFSQPSNLLDSVSYNDNNSEVVIDQFFGNFFFKKQYIFFS